MPSAPRPAALAVERQWLHENNARYAEMVCRTLRDALEPRPKGSREADLRDRIFNYILAQPCYPLDDYGRPGWHLGIVDGAAAVLVGTAEKGKALGLRPRARIVAAALVGDEPTIMLTAPAPASQRALKKAGARFDLIILDPPKFAHSARQVENAARGYKDINLLAFQLLRQGGVLATFSCSGAISSDLFQKIVFAAAVDARCDAQIVRWLAQASDHPVALTFPEGAYLKGLLCRVWK